MTARYQVLRGADVLLTFRANLAMLSSHIQVCNPDGTAGVAIPLTGADARCRPAAAARLVNGWCRLNGHERWPRGATGLTLRTYRPG